MFHSDLHLNEMFEGRLDDFRREGQRGNHCPGGNRAVVWPKGNAARYVIKEHALNAVKLERRRARPFAGC